MSNRYKGGVISATPPTTTGGDTGTASGAWTLEQQMQLQAAGLWPSQPPPPFVEDVFSTYLWAGNSGAQTITNNINLSGKGGLVWVKNRTSVANNTLQDTVRGVDKNLYSNTTDAQTSGGQLTSFTTTGFTISGSGTEYNASGSNYVSWTFREQPKFFDVVTYTGNGTAGRTVAHNLGSVPGCIIIKGTTGPASTQNWEVYHRSTGNTQALFLDLTQAPDVGAQHWNNTSPTSTEFTLGAGAGVNNNTTTYVAYLFAHNAGGFGLTETDNVISCGSFTGAGATTPVTVNIGFEPQWLLAKQSSGTGGSWVIVDNMRGFTATTNGNVILYPNSSGADDPGNYIPGQPTATGFNGLWSSGETFIYIAIRRGPMKVPTSGTSVFSPIARNGTGAVATVTTTNLPDSIWSMNRSGATGYPAFFYDRLRGANTFLIDNDGAEIYDAANSTRFSVTAFNNLSYALGIDGNYAGINGLTSGYANWILSRAPSYFDEVCYTGTGSARTVTHNLQAVPELMIVKTRSLTGRDWVVYSSALGATKAFYLNQPDAAVTSSVFWNDTAPTSSVFTVGTGGTVNLSAATYVAYLFATCAGVSKVGSYTGTGATQTIACGFAAGARFVLIKRTDTTGAWYVWDSARGMTSGTDPSLLLNSLAAEVNANSVFAITTGFQIVSTAADINASGGTYIFLAIA